MPRRGAAGTELPFDQDLSALYALPKRITRASKRRKVKPSAATKESEEAMKVVMRARAKRCSI